MVRDTMMKERASKSSRSTSKDEDHHGYERSYDQRVTIDHEEWCLWYGFETWREVRSILHMDLPEQVYKARFMVYLRKNRLWHNILYWQVYINHRTTCTEWRGKMILHFRGSDYRRYLSLTWYDMMDSFLMDRYFTKSKVGSNLQGWMQKTRICW